MSLSVTVIEGNTGKDPEVQYSGAGKPYLKFSVAVSRNFKKGDSYPTDWFNCVCFNENTIDFFERNGGLQTGQRVVVRGRMESNKSESGTTYWNLIADEVSTQFAKSDGPKSKSSGPPSRSAGKPSPNYGEKSGGYANSHNDLDDELPPF